MLDRHFLRLACVQGAVLGRHFYLSPCGRQLESSQSRLVEVKPKNGYFLVAVFCLEIIVKSSIVKVL